MSGARNSPTCGVCGRKLVKNGVTSAGRTRWRCRTCGASSTQARSDITGKAQLRAFLSWLLDFNKPGELASSPRTFRRETAWCWRIEVPPPPPPPIAPDVVILDGTYFQHWCLLIATDGHHVLDWQWCDREKKIAWQQILTRLPAPRMVVVDGGTGLHAALASNWPTTRIQRCYFHIFQTVRRHHTLRPRLDPSREILSLTRALMHVRDIDQAVFWLTEYAVWEARWDQFLRHRTYPRAHTERPAGISEHQHWWYTHRDLRKTRGLYRTLIRNKQLFTWIDPELTDPGHLLPRTTSSLEGGPNRALKDLFRAHRGLPTEHARRAAEWKLNSLTATPRDPWSLVRPEHRNPPRRQHTQHLDDEPLGPTLGTEFSWEDGNGIQQGWAGRSRH
ncbi:IS1249 family transposase [Mycolicibacter arupensis]|uniref:IS1249 family transposase n=1 Tax=Mycolicibacter arupensis TaxID=342002 RepID=A0A5C7XR38_9MYCO|nr:IS1249 family transposase [Mycolicibacter arupensis]TXI51987.1 MAG: IS1249 family transposase [Mycolicibacter arupensis]